VTKKILLFWVNDFNKERTMLTWETPKGTRELSDIDDVGLNNLIWVIDESFGSGSDSAHVKEAKRIAKGRGYNLDLFGKGQLPYRNKNDKWCMLNPNTQSEFTLPYDPEDDLISLLDEMKLQISNVTCECGAHKVKHSFHSHWCPDYVDVFVS